MNALLFCLLLFIGQLTSPKDVVRLPPGKDGIPSSYGGKLVELLNAPADVSLPSRPPSTGTMWSVNIKNLGPHEVTIRNGNQMRILLQPNESAILAWRGSSAYVRIR